jgi:glycosyltransferase involved in cell wall biosynthesis
MQPLKAIHQFAIQLSPSDGISNGIRFTQKLLRQAGLISEIFVPDSNASSKDGTHPLSSYSSDGHALLLIHHGIGNGYEAELRRLADPCIMVFHNITPGQFFPTDHPIQPMLRHGWQQVDTWKNWLIGAIADSEHNRQDLLKRGYTQSQTATIPLLVDTAAQRRQRLIAPARPLKECFRLLFVGRLMPHKNQHRLVQALGYLNRMSTRHVQLVLAGTGDDAYKHQLEQIISEQQLEQHVTLAGNVPDTTLAELYASADLYVSLSQHEGFGMPLIEAMSHGLPVLAWSAPNTSIAETVSQGGLLLETDEPEQVAATILALMDEPQLRAGLRQCGYQRVAEFQPQALYMRLSSFLKQQGYTLPTERLAEMEPPTGPIIRLEGPYDSSYSLAIVNHQLACALNRLRPGKVALHASEGPTDLVPSEDFMRQHPETERMATHPEAAQAEVVMRLMYPPRVTGMNGLHNGLTCYGWEESRLPPEFIESFNQHLQFATSMSTWVTKTLIDNGLSCPITTTGIGADHILEATPAPQKLPSLGKGLRILHISSCFPRKGVDILLEAYARAFDQKCADKVTLIIKTFPNPHHDIEKDLKHWRKTHPHAPDIVLINQDLEAGAIRSLYQQCDLLVAPSRGEGFGLPMAEAMLHQLPVITTGYGGQTDFCTPDTAWLIDYTFARARTHMGQGESVWIEPDVDHLAQLLQQFLTARVSDEAWQTFTQNRIKAALTHVSRNFSWDEVARRMYNCVDNLDSRPVLRQKPRIGCVTTWNSKCGIATYSQKLLTPALKDTIVLANINAELTAPDSAEVVRCWTAGTRDNLERLYQEICRHQLDTVLIQFNFSFFGLPALKQLLANLQQRGVHVLMTFHSTADVYWGKQLKTLRDLLPELSRISRILVHSVHDLNRLKSFGLVENTLLFPHGVDRAKPNQLTCPDPQWRQSQQSTTVFASYGFLLPHKGIQNLIKGFILFNKQHPDSHLLLVNALYPVDESQQEADACRKLINASGCADKITLINDFLTDDASMGWLRQADAIVFPYQHTQESSSAAVRWGLAVERPVLCTPLPIFEDVSSAVGWLPGTEPDDISLGLQAFMKESKQSLAQRQQRQSDWLNTHDWQHLSHQLKHVMMALYLNEQAQPG